MLPGPHAVGHAFVEVGRAHHSLDAPAPKPLAHFVADPGEGEGDSLALKLFDGAQRRVAAAGVDEVNGIGVHKHMFRGWGARSQRGLQPVVKVTDTCEKHVTADAPNQQTGENDRVGMAPDVAISLVSRQLTEHGTLRVAGSIY